MIADCAGGGKSLLAAIAEGLRLAATLDLRLWEIVGLSLAVSLSAVIFATLLGLPLGAAIGVSRFPGRQAIVVALNALMGLPPVVVGLVVYLLLSRAGAGRAAAHEAAEPAREPAAGEARLRGARATAAERWPITGISRLMS